MNLIAIILALRTQWASAMTDTPLYLQIGPENPQSPYCVMNFGTVSASEYTTEDCDYEASINFVCYSASDTECLARMDRIAAAFDKAKFAGTYYSALVSASFDLNYTDQAALWSSEMQFSIRWNR